MSRKFSGKYVVNLKSSHMLSIFSGSNIEHPYRFQPYVKLVVPFEEYREFCREMVELSVSWLTFDVKMYQKALETEADSNLLLRLYYLDLSKSVLNEFLLSVVNGVDGTIICGDMSDGNITHVSLEDVGALLMTNSSEDRSKGLESIKKDIVYDFDIGQVSEHNKMLLNYSILLRVISYQNNPQLISLS